MTSSVWLAMAATTLALAMSCGDGDPRPGQGNAVGGYGAAGTGSGQQGGDSSGAGKAGSGGLGGAGAGSGGVGGEGGAVPEWAEHDPTLCACDYRPSDDLFYSQLACTADLSQLARRIGELSCDALLDVDYVTRTECANGVVERLMVVGGENEYETTTQDGALVAAFADGYVSGLCGAASDTLTVRAGDPPEATDCVTCQVCGGPYGSEGDAGAAGAPSTFSGFPRCKD